jgi:hypothetical protein
LGGYKLRKEKQAANILVDTFLDTRGFAMRNVLSVSDQVPVNAVVSPALLKRIFQIRIANSNFKSRPNFKDQIQF